MGKRNERILKVYWSEKEKDFIIQYPRRCDGVLIQGLFNKRLEWGGLDGKDKGWLNYCEFNVVEELIERGYDKKSLKFEIRLNEDSIL
jgi:hypothetical protein